MGVSLSLPLRLSSVKLPDAALGIPHVFFGDPLIELCRPAFPLDPKECLSLNFPLSSHFLDFPLLIFTRIWHWHLLGVLLGARVPRFKEADREGVMKPGVFLWEAQAIGQRPNSPQDPERTDELRCHLLWGEECEVLGRQQHELALSELLFLVLLDILDFLPLHGFLPMSGEFLSNLVQLSHSLCCIWVYLPLR